MFLTVNRVPCVPCEFLEPSEGIGNGILMVMLLVWTAIAHKDCTENFHLIGAH